MEPLLASSSYDQDDSSEVAVLLNSSEGAVNQKRRHKCWEGFMFIEAIVKADFFVGVGMGFLFSIIGIAQGEKDTTILPSIFSVFAILWGSLVEELFQNILPDMLHLFMLGKFRYSLKIKLIN